MNLNDNRLIIKTLKSGDQKVFSLVYASYYKPLCMGHRTKRFFQWSGKMGKRF